MASGSQSDTSLWLHNKLGTSNDSWIGGSIVSQLTPDILVKIQHCFQDLQPQVKLKLLLSFFHIPRRNLEQWRRELENILVVARDDSEPWVCMLAELVKTFPSSGQLCSDVSVPDANRKIFNDLLSDLKKALKKSSVTLSEGSRKEHLVLPLECHYLNKNAFMSIVGHQPQSIKHFTLRRKPKAAALRAELLTKSSDAANKMKTNASAFPMRKSTMPRKMSDNSALKGLTNRTSMGSGGFNRNSRMALNPNKKEGGVKLLDITEQPIGSAAMKKRKRQQEIEDAKKFAEETKAENKIDTTNANNAKNNAKETPDYAVGLSTLNPPTPAPPPAYAPPTPAYAPPTPSMQPVSVQPTPPSTSIVAGLPQQTTNTILIQQPQLPTTPLPLSHATTPALPTQPLPVSSAPTTTARITNIPIGLNQLQPLPQSALPSSTLIARLPTQPTPLTPSGTTTARLVQLPTQPIPPNRVAQITTRQPAPPVSLLTSNLQPGTRIIRTIQAPNPMLATQQVQQQQQQQQPQQQPPQQNPGQPAQQQQRKHLTLTKEQMFEAQEMFRTANKVTRPEKALILGFMAGSRDNPCPHLGNVVTIKLSENQESVLQNDGTYLTMIVETHFQMNYSTGEWKRIKKYRRLED